MFHVKHCLDDTIAAIATPLGVGGVGVVRISGDQSIRILEEIIQDFPKKIEPRKIYHSWIFKNKTPIDEVIYYYMKAPSSYTGEDVVEINCHGGLQILQTILEMIIKAGARQAEKGEFTKRAFINEKMDLAQAESVTELVCAPTQKGAGYALQQLQGGLSKITDKIRKNLMSSLAKIEANIDFPDDVEELNYRQLIKSFKQEIKQIKKLISTEKAGKIYRDGLATVIIGKPNVGKSSLLNALIGEERAIVTHLPGTTRDSIEEMFSLKGIPLRVVDTAGIRKPSDRAEEAGIGRTEKQAESADLIIMVIDSSQRLDKWDRMVLSKGKGKQGVVVLNKSDLKTKISERELKSMVNGFKIYKTTAITGQGVHELIDGVYSHIKGLNNIGSDTSIAINARHKGCLARAKDALEKAVQSCQSKAPADCVTIDLKESVIALGEVSGELVSEEVINDIFSRFCVGK